MTGEEVKVCLVCGKRSGLDDYCDGCAPDSTVDDRLRRLDLGCSYCPPHRSENASRRAKHGKTKPRYKNVDRKKPSGCRPGCPGCRHEG